MAMFRRRGIKPLWVFIAVALVLLAALLFTFNTDREKATLPEQAAAGAAEPALGWFSTATGAVKGFFLRLFGLRDVDREYEQLSQQLAQLELENQWMQELARENERLTDLLGFVEAYPQHQVLHAKVIARDPESWYSIFIINRGAADGIKANMAVVTKDGMAGRILEVGEHYAKVLTVIDRQSAVAVVVERSRDQGILKGSTDAQSSSPLCSIYYLPFGADLVPGDSVLTSGVDGIFMKGLPLGEVVAVSRQDSLESFARVRPYVDFDHIENVLVILDTTNQSILAATPTPTPEMTPVSSPQVTPAAETAQPQG